MESFFRRDAVEIAYLDEGEGEPVVLIHGFASNKEVNWVQPGWVAALTDAGRRAIALDNRGHGRSSKFYDPADYHTRRMAEDALSLMDHLKLPRADILGYSMGARIAAFLALDHPQRVRSAILGGLGMNLIEGVGAPDHIAAALEAPDPAQVTDPQPRMFRAFAEQTKSDRHALAACIRGARQTLTREEATAIRVPVLVVVGSEDTIAGSAEALAALIPGAKAVSIARRDHMRTVGDKLFKAAVLDFLLKRP